MKVLTILILCSVLFSVVFVEGKKKKGSRFSRRINNNVIPTAGSKTKAKVTERPVTIVTTKQPVAVEKKPGETTKEKQSAYVPVDILEKLRKVNNLNDFLNTFNPPGVIKKDGDSSDVLKFITREESGTSERVFADPDPKKIACVPRPKLVQLPIDYSAIHYPACVELMQCGGCCHNSLTEECVASKVINKRTTVFRIPFQDGIPRAHDVNLLHHAECKCQCRVRPEDCSENHEHDPVNCQCQCNRKQIYCPLGKTWSHQACDCVCSNKRSCYSKRQVWNPKKCTCECKPKNCSKRGLVLDQSSCRCVAVTVGRK